MIAKLFGFHGGVKPETNKAVSAQTPIRIAPVPKRLIVPLRFDARPAARCIVKIGQHVLKGECIGEAEGALGTACHAPTSGTVVDIIEHAMPHPSGLPTGSVVIEPDGEDRWTELHPLDYQNSDRMTILDHIRNCGVVGMGGAAFPSHIKLGNEKIVKTLILNGAECEPWITADDRLMRERAPAILRGALILKDLLGADRILVGVEDNKPEAIAAMREASAAIENGPEIIPVPTLYPAGGEKQLTRVLTGIEVPHGRRSSEFGLRCFNVATAEAIHRAVDLGEPVLSRVVTLTGNVQQPGNWDALIGTAMDDLLPLVEPREDTDRYILGGPMMGFAIPDMAAPVVKSTNCIIAASPKLFPPPPPEQPCIRCGACAEACPADLQPFELYWFSRAKNFGKAQEYNLFDCIECGCCSYVCPAHIPLVDYFRFSKSEIWARERESKAADQARDRFEFRNYRQEREKAEKAAKLAAKAAETKAKLAADASATAAASAAPAADEDPKKALIAAALARAKAQKAEAPPRNTEALSPNVEAEIADIEARRQQAGLSEAPAPDVPATPEDEKKARIAAAMQKARERRGEAAPATEAAPAAAAAKAVTADADGDEAAAKKARIEAAMQKARERRAQAESGESVQSEVPAATPPAAPEPAAEDSEAAAKKARIELAMQRARERRGQSAEAAAPAAEEPPPSVTPAPAEAPVESAQLDDEAAAKKARIELAMQKARERRAEAAQEAAPAAAMPPLPEAEPAAPPAAELDDEAAAKKARIELAMQRARERRAEREQEEK